MEEKWARTWMREQVDAALANHEEPTTTYNVGGVPLSVTGEHVAFMVVPARPTTDGEPGGDA